MFIITKNVERFNVKCYNIEQRSLIGRNLVIKNEREGY